MTRIDHSLRPTLPLTGAVATASDEDAADALAGALDDDTVGYVMATRSDFDALKRAAGQLAGLLVLAAVGAKSITQEHAMLDAARAAHAEAVDRLAAARVPRRAVHHHHHLTLAAATIGMALDRAAARMDDYAAGRREVDAALEPLKRGYRELQGAAGTLPGFEIVSFEQACCAGHGGSRAGDIAQNRPHTGRKRS